MAVTITEVQKLNKTIESLNTQRTKIEAQEEMLRRSLSEELAKYKEAYGVDLEGKTLAETKKLFEKEAIEVKSTVEAEYELSKKVVELISEGDIEEANRLLGVAEKAEEPVVDMEELETSKPKAKGKGLKAVGASKTSGVGKPKAEAQGITKKKPLKVVETPVEVLEDEVEDLEGIEAVEVEAKGEDVDVNGDGDGMVSLQEAIEEVENGVDLDDDESDYGNVEVVEDEDELIFEDDEVGDAGVFDMDFGFGDMFDGKKFEENGEF